ncbi:MAG: sigma-54-dependent transcriptional regulator [bacterium]
MSSKAKILIIDDDKQLLVSCSKIFKNNGRYQVVTMHDSRQALSEIETGQYDVIISDLSMPDMSGMDLLHKAKLIAPDVPFVIFSAYGNVERVVEAMREGAFDFIEKPFKADRLKVVVEKSLSHRNLYKEKRALENQLQQRYSFDNIIGKSPVMQRVFDMIARVADGESNIAIIGESGTGKELVARSIHVHSYRSSRAFVPVNCGAFPENLFESELFGYEKGAFTGAFRRKPGLLEFADGGTFFLDEICELSPTLQVKLLRMLQDKKIRRVGGTELVDVDVRIISASNLKMEEALESGALREDLYYRLNVISIHLPPLRERREDIPILCKHFIEKYIKLSPKNIKGFSEEALRYLENYNWPGNVRELENVIERAITLAATDWIQPVDLPDKIVGRQDSVQTVQIDTPLKVAKDQVLAQFECEYLVKMLTRHNGNITQAAKNSGIDRRSFHRLLNRYKINSRDWKQN